MRTAQSSSLRGSKVFLLSIAFLLVSPSIALASSPPPHATPRYTSDRVIVRFREAPLETDLEIFTGRQFLTLVDYVGLSYPPGLGWYLFRIDDGMDAALVRDLLRKDPMVCNAELVAIGERHAVGFPGSEQGSRPEAAVKVKTA